MPSTIKIWLLLDDISEGRNSGKISNANLFGSALSLERMKQMTEVDGGECGTFGDLLSWENTAVWDLGGNATILTVTDPHEAPCWKESQLHVFMGEFDQPMCMQHCQKIGGGRSPHVGTIERWNNYTQELDAITEFTTQLGFIWLASTVGKTLGGKLTRLDHWPKNINPAFDVWRDFYTGERYESFISADKQYPNEEYAHCLYMMNYWKSGPKGFQAPCDTIQQFSCACQYHRKPPILRLLGLCANSALRGVGSAKALSVHFTPRQLPASPRYPFFVNGVAARIEFSESSNQWTLLDAGSNVTARSKAGRTSYALGKYNWTFEGDSKCEANEYLLKITGCFEGQFTCSDGECISMEGRCDHTFDCRDRY